MRLVLSLSLLVFSACALAAATPASAHLVKSEGCDPTHPWVDTNPLNNDPLGPDPDAILVVHVACSWVDCVTDIFPVFACQPHG